MKQEYENWNATTDRFVGFFDIMGFKDNVLKNKHEDILKMLENIKNINTAIIDGTMQNMAANTNLRSFQFSDSFFIFSVSNTPRDLFNLLRRSRVLLGYCFSEKIPLKGALSFGKITADFDKSIFIGQPIIDAYLLHESIDMFGAALDHNAEKNLMSFY